MTGIPAEILHKAKVRRKIIENRALDWLTAHPELVSQARAERWYLDLVDEVRTASMVEHDTGRNGPIDVHPEQIAVFKQRAQSRQDLVTKRETMAAPPAPRASTDVCRSRPIPPPTPDVVAEDLTAETEPETLVPGSQASSSSP